MFRTFLNKEGYNNLDFSVFLEFSPDIVMEYFHHGIINLNLELYHELKRQFADPENYNENIPKWLLFIDKILEMEDDLENLAENPNLNCAGPAYYTKTNTRFFFSKDNPPEETINSEDIHQLEELACTPCIDDLIAKYYATLKCKPSSKKSREELLYDLDICITALDVSNQINRQVEFQNHLIMEREKFLNAPYMVLAEPSKPEDKPDKPQKKNFTIKAILNRNREKLNSYSAACEQYNHNLKIYYIKYREYEKSCDRYKKALKEWETEKNHLINWSIEDIKKSKLKIKKGNRILKIYNEVLRSLDIHQYYLNLNALRSFRHFLESGRAATLQECMNLFETQLQWEQLRDSQARIERNILATVYYISPEAAATKDDSSNTSAKLESIIEKIKEGLGEKI
ncbi:MAG: hypothetical protein ACM3MK_01920 [Chitinophagales bacterium]